MRKKIIFLFLIFFYSCVKNNGTSTGNPLVNISMTGSQQAATAAVKFNKLSWLINSAYAYAPPASILDLSGGSVSLTDFWFNISNIEFKLSEVADAGEVDGSEVELAGPYTVNIFSNNPQSMGSAMLNQNSIRRIKYRTQKVLDSVNGNPIGMINNSIYLSGSISGNNFIFKSSEELQFETAGPNAVTFNSGDNVLLQIDTAELIRKINLSSVLNGDVISESNRKSFLSPCPGIDASASDIYTCFIKGFQLKTRLGKDDGDSIFEPGEETVN